jgi:hypothetical protein
MNITRTIDRTLVGDECYALSQALDDWRVIMCNRHGMPFNAVLFLRRLHDIHVDSLWADLMGKIGEDISG